jgi:hypothetical protein
MKPIAKKAQKTFAPIECLLGQKLKANELTLI